MVSAIFQMRNGKGIQRAVQRVGFGMGVNNQNIHCVYLVLGKSPHGNEWEGIVEINC